MKKFGELLDLHGDKIKELLHDPVFFIENVCVDFVLTDYQRSWIRQIHEHDRINFTAFRSSGKTEILMVCYFTYLAFVNLRFYGLVISASREQSIEVLRRIRDVIMASEVLRTAVPDNRSQNWSKTELELKNGSRIACKPYTDRIRGLHVDVVACDEAGEYRDQELAQIPHDNRLP